MIEQLENINKKNVYCVVINCSVQIHDPIVSYTKSCQKNILADWDWDDVDYSIELCVG